MAKSETNNNPQRQGRRRLRRLHRKLGTVLLIFVLLLAVTGIALNHASALKLDERFVRAGWLLDAYGIRAPAPAAHFVDAGRAATLLGGRLYLDGQATAVMANQLRGFAVLDRLVVAASAQSLFVLLPTGELVEAIDLSLQNPAPVIRLGRHRAHVVIDGGDTLLVSDRDVSAFLPDAGLDAGHVTWPAASAPGAELLETIEAQYRGNGLSLQRLVADLHSGRIVSRAGRYLVDIAGLAFIVLGISGLCLRQKR